MSERMRQHLDGMRELEEGWDSYGAEPIPPNVVDLALVIYDALIAAGVEIQRVAPTNYGCAVIYTPREAVEVEDWSEWADHSEEDDE